MKLDLTLNGAPVTTEVPPTATLLEVLREDLGARRVISPKDGCSPQGQCGCCVVLVDGVAKVSCALPCDKAQGKSITTLEGVPEAEQRLYGEAFARVGGLQCGYCIPGIVMRAKSVLDADPSPSDEDLRKKLDVHLCRCTGYQRIVEAIQLVAEVKRGGALPPADVSGKVGTSLDRFQAVELALGQRPYVDDMQVPGMLFGAVRLSDHARAKVLRIDVTRALALPGVEKIVTARDVPGNRTVGILYTDWPTFIAEGEETHYVGDVLAAVAATSTRVAREAAQLIDIEYEVLEPLTSAEAALAPGAPQIGPKVGNLLSKSVIKKGDADAALASAPIVLEETFQTQRIEHAFLEPESALAVPEADGGLKLYTQGQGIFDDQRQVASVLGLDVALVRVELVPNGGAFGGKEDMSVQAQTALLAHVLRRAVKLTLTREQSLRMHPKRHPIRMHYVVGCDADGRLLAVKARMVGDSGAYASVGGKVLERAAGHACGPYKVPHVDVEARAAYTNNVPCGAMRGFGANQAAFAMEGMLDRIADRLGKDRWQLRWQNALDVGDTFSTGQVLEASVGIKKTLQAIKPHYDAAVAAGKAVGIGCGIKNTGIGNGVPEYGKCRLVVESPQRIALYNGYTEMGQGLFTVLVQFASEVSGVPPQLFAPITDTTFALQCGQTTGSRATLFSGNAAIQAATRLRSALAEAGPAGLGGLVGQVFEGECKINDTTPLGAAVEKIKTHTAFSYATQLVVLDADGKLERVYAAHDVGRAINPVLCSAQVEGSVHMGLGYALSEDFACDERGWPVDPTMRGIGVMRARHVPPIEVILVEDHEPAGPFGAKGVGEIGLVPTAGAVAGALWAHDRVWRRQLPMLNSPAARSIVGKARAEAWAPLSKI